MRWGATTQNIVATGDLLLIRKSLNIFCSQLNEILAAMAERGVDMPAAGPYPWAARRAHHLRLQGRHLE